MASSISSAEPEKLFRYSEFGMQIDRDLTLEAGRLSAALKQFEAACTEPGFQVSVSHLGGALHSYGVGSESVDLWVRQVGRGFQMADWVWYGTHPSPGSAAYAEWPIPAWATIVISIAALSPLVPAWLTRLMLSLPWLRGYARMPGVPEPLGQPTEAKRSGFGELLGQPPARSVSMPTTKPTIERSPVPFDKVKGINWYGNTEFAYQNRGRYYRQLQGLHSGLDFAVPAGTPITNTVNRTGKIISVNGKPYNYEAGPGSILVDYGDFLILYGHTSQAPKVGDKVEPGQIVGYTGTDGSFEHLHMEVIRKDPEWEKLPPEKQATTRPGNVRTNPVPYLAPDLRKQMEEKQWGTFHPTPDNRWQTPDDQPDIIPGKPYVV